jgi:hypothetical protein
LASSQTDALPSNSSLADEYGLRLRILSLNKFVIILIDWLVD